MAAFKKQVWVSATRTDAKVCVICGRRWCTITADGKAVKCMHVESRQPVASGGWIHDLADALPVPKPREPKKLKDVSGVAMKMFRDKLAPAKREKLSATLGVSHLSLWSLRVGIGWDWDGREFASFPSRDAAGKIVGITWRYDDAEKKTMAGTSNSGVFAPERWWMALGPVLIVEGASDVAALVTHHFCALGRPSNIGGADVLRGYIKRRAAGRGCIVLGENDCKPERRGKFPQCPLSCRGCSACFPGLYGAKKVAWQLGVRYAMLPVAYKDVRAWANADVDFRASFTAWISKVTT